MKQKRNRFCDLHKDNVKLHKFAREVLPVQDRSSFWLLVLLYILQNSSVLVLDEASLSAKRNDVITLEQTT